jgi:hypothetical protein
MKIARIVFVPLIVFAIAVCIVSFFAITSKRTPVKSEIKDVASLSDIQVFINSWPGMVESASTKRLQWAMTETDYPIRAELFVSKNPADWTRCVATRDPKGDKSSVRTVAYECLRSFAPVAFLEKPKAGEYLLDGNGSNSVVEWQHFTQDEPHQYLHEIRFRLAR